MSKTNFNLDKATRQTPYTVPERFFESLEKDILAKTVDAPNNAASTPRKLNPLSRFIRIGLSSAAAVAVATAIGIGIYNTVPAEPLTPDQAFANLSSSDQDYLLDCYDNDRMLEAYLLEVERQ